MRDLLRALLVPDEPEEEAAKEHVDAKEGKDPAQMSVNLRENIIEQNRISYTMAAMAPAVICSAVQAAFVRQSNKYSQSSDSVRKTGWPRPAVKSHSNMMMAVRGRCRLSQISPSSKVIESTPSRWR